MSYRGRVQGDYWQEKVYLRCKVSLAHCIVVQSMHQHCNEVGARPPMMRIAKMV